MGSPSVRKHVAGSELRYRVECCARGSSGRDEGGARVVGETPLVVVPYAAAAELSE